jgi:5-methylcytosine-specific restriction endonuclease McrA
MSSKSIPLNEILDGLHPSYQTYKLKNRLIKEKILENICSECGLNEWNNKPINLELDHINGVRTNHKLENLRLLCPNCHSQTDTYRSKNRI